MQQCVDLLDPSRNVQWMSVTFQLAVVRSGLTGLLCHDDGDVQLRLGASDAPLPSTVLVIALGVEHQGN